MTPASAKPDAFLSAKFRFWSFVSMLLLVYVHGYNMREGYLEPMTLPREPMTFTGFFEYWVANGAVRFRIPMLFAISGYLFALGDAAPHGQRMVKRLRSLGIPYLAWAVIAIGITFLFEARPGPLRDAVLTSGLAGDRLAWQYSWDVYLDKLLMPIGFQFWFIRTLLLCNLLYPLLRKGLESPRRWPLQIVTGVLVLAWLLHVQIPLLVVPEAFLSFGLGVWLAKRGGVPAAPPLGLPAWVWGLACLALVTAKTWLAFATPDYPDHMPEILALLFMHKLCIVTGLIAAWYGLDALVRHAMANAAFVWASAFSFFIYALHVPLVNYLNALAAHLYHADRYHRLLTYLFLPLGIIAFAILTGALLRATLPGVYGLLTGGRGGVKKRVAEVVVA